MTILHCIVSDAMMQPDKECMPQRTHLFGIFPFCTNLGVSTTQMCLCALFHVSNQPNKQFVQSIQIAHASTTQWHRHHVNVTSAGPLRVAFLNMVPLSHGQKTPHWWKQEDKPRGEGKLIEWEGLTC